MNNIGTAAASGGYTVNYYLSADNQLDPGDNLLGQHEVDDRRPANIGCSAYAFTPTGAVSGEYLIAQMSPEVRLDIVNPTIDVAVALIP